MKLMDALKLVGFFLLVVFLLFFMSGCHTYRETRYEPIWLEENRCPAWPRVTVDRNVPQEAVPISSLDIEPFHLGCKQRFGVRSCATQVHVYMDPWMVPGHRVRCGDTGKLPPGTKEE